MSNKTKVKAKKTWQGVLGTILIIATIILLILAFTVNEEMFFGAIVLGILGFIFIVKGSNAKETIVVSGDLVLSYKWNHIFLKVDGYDEDEHDVNKGLSPFDVLIDYNNKRPIVYKMESGKIVHLEQCMVVYCTVNDIKRIYAVLNPIEYEEFGFEEPNIILAYLEAGDEELYPETDEIFQKEFFDIFKYKYELFIKQHEEKKKSNNDGGILGAAKDFGKIMGGIFADAVGISSSNSSRSDNYDAIVQDGGYERKLKYQYFDYGKQYSVYRDEMGDTWYSDDNGQTFFR